MRLIALLCIPLLLHAQNPNAAVFPDSIATDRDLAVAKDQSESKLSAAINASTLSIPVTDGTRFLEDSIIAIGPEQMQICSISVNTLTVCSRGFAGTTAQSHLKNTAVRGIFTAHHHNQLAAEVKAVQGEIADNRAYQFTLSNGIHFTADLSASGAKTITISAPYACPLGVNGTNAEHYLYISGGTGTAEAVLITGGTATSGSTGTLEFTTANAHTGAYTITSATAGIQEAAHAAGPAGHVLVSRGSHTIYATISIHSTASATRRVSISGVHRAASKIVADSTLSGPGFIIADYAPVSEEGGQYGVSNLTFDFRNADSSDIIQVGSGDDVGVGNVGPAVHHCTFWGGARALYIATGPKLWLGDLIILKDTAATPAIYMDVTATGSAHKGGHVIRDTEIGYSGSDPGTAAAIHLYCGTTEVNGCNWTIIDTLDVLGKWNHALLAEAPERDIPLDPAGMYITINMLIAESFYTSHAVKFVNTSFNQIKDSWLSNVNTSGSAGALYIENGVEVLISGNYLYTGSTSPHVQLNGGSRHYYGNNRFVGPSFAFGFDATNDTGTSTVGFNHFTGGVYSQADKWLAFTALSGNNTLPVISPFSVKFSDATTSPMVFENIDTGATNPKKWVYIDSTGHYRMLNNAASAFIFSVSDSGLVYPGTTTFANLPAAANSGMIYCSDCTVTSGSDNTCAGSGTGAMAFYLNSAYRCFAPVGP